MQTAIQIPLPARVRVMFARHGTMQRSEKRSSVYEQRSSQQAPAQRPPRKRRPRAGFFYKLLTVLLLLLLWPAGMILLWRKKLRWSSIMKVFTSIITLMASILLLGTALTVETDNPRYTALQDRAMQVMDRVVDTVGNLGNEVGARFDMSCEALSDIYSVYRSEILNGSADALDWGVRLVQPLRNQLFPPTEGSGTPTDADATPASDAAQSPSPSGNAEPPAEDEPELPAATSVPAAEIEVSAADAELPVYIPETTPDIAEGARIRPGYLLRTGVLDTDVSLTDLPTDSETTDALRFALKPAGAATVYLNERTGSYYHLRSSCGPMKTADAYTLAEIVDFKHEPCSRCNPPAKELAEEEYVVWLDENGLAHLTDECANFAGQWQLETADAAIEAGSEGCPECGADRYLAALAAGENVQVESIAEEAGTEASASPEGTEEAEPGAESTPSPTPEAAEDEDEAGVTVSAQATAGTDNTPDAKAGTDATADTAAEASATPEAEVSSTAAEADTTAGDEDASDAAQSTPDADGATPDADEAGATAAIGDAGNATQSTPDADEADANVGDEDAADAAQTTPDAGSATSEASEDSTASSPSAAPTEATPAPETGVIRPAATLKPAGEMMVYHTPNGKFYHIKDRCSGMLGAKLHTLASSVADGFRQCPVCGAPAEALATSEEILLWCDENRLCHVSDECTAFAGQCSLISREEALEQGLEGCAQCGAAEYLLPDSIVETPTPGEPPEAEPTQSPHA